MTPNSGRFGAKPAVLRCGRCGKYVDWEDAQLQIICTCRPHIDLPPVFVREATDTDGPAVRALFDRDFGATSIIAFGERLDLDSVPALVAAMRDEPAGALAYRLFGDSLHIVALATDPMWQRSGVGGHLVAEAELLARRLNLGRVIVSTTNDNIPALYFYQRRGYRIIEIVPEGLLPHAAHMRPGFAGIPVRDEIRMEKKLQ